MMTSVCSRPAVRAFLGSALALAATVSLGAQAIPILNAGFEDDVITPGAFVVIPGGPSGWSVYDPLGLIDDNANSVGVIAPAGSTYFPGGAAEGSNAALVYLGGGASGAAGLEQTLDAVLTAQTRYTLSVAVGNIASGVSLAGSTGGPGVFFDLDGFPGYRVDLLAGGVVVASDQNSLGALIPEGEWRTATVSLTVLADHAQLGGVLGIRLVNLDQPGSPGAPNIEVDFDAVSLTAVPIPEPAAWAVCLGLAALGLAAARRRASRRLDAGRRAG